MAKNQQAALVTELERLDRFKRLVVAAMFSDPGLTQQFLLKGGNASDELVTLDRLWQLYWRKDWVPPAGRRLPNLFSCLFWHADCLTNGVRRTSFLFTTIVWLLARHSAESQVYWNTDFESPTVFVFQFAQSVGGPDMPFGNGATVDVGAPHNHVLQVQVDSLSPTNPWTAYWVMAPMSGTGPVVNYDPSHTFLKFDVQVSQVRPFHVRLIYSGGDFQDLDVDVHPTITNDFQTFLVPLTAFISTIYYITYTAFPAFPTGLNFGIHGDPADPPSTWPPASDNTFRVDNIAYIISPRLSIARAGENVLLSWPTNSDGFVLQQNANPGTPTWQTVTNTPVVNNGVNQVMLPATGAEALFRLSFGL
jgi:hypothetical protein